MPDNRRPVKHPVRHSWVRGIVFLVVVVVGVLFAVLGLEGTFTFVSCGPGGRMALDLCVRAVGLDLLAIVGGGGAVLGAGLLLIRDAVRLHKADDI